ncbi:hypothetical protein K2173_004763 [Erythroxylum novogranatense]|uniref:Tafazzin family protein n=1 Tax=Erythroxylum novogranatense TaxID=1862640 RepID=A0AAV8SKQ0_9ROSI|nr:hypothetical protein K2173_004763 [Erythroxylum novogranatense]
MSVQRFERDVWKSKARVLQLRIRDRFRVAVDRRHRLTPLFADGYFSSKVQRWISRFREFRRDSLQTPSAFYRKRVSKDFNAEEDSVIMNMLRSVTLPLIGNMCHVFMNGLNSVQVYGVEKLYEALLRRPENKPLLTVSNHVASVDDPFVIASLLPPRVLLDAQNIRWTLCASDRCFKNPVTSTFFRCVKVLPVARGDGIYQKGMDMAIAKLNSGGWVHIFPEGSRSRDGGKTMGSAKRGVGRLVLDADTLPIVVPFVHTGMQEIMPIGANFPRIGKTVTVLVGDPIHLDDLLDEEAAKRISRGHLYDAVASRIGQRLHELKIQVEKLAYEHSCELQHPAEENMGKASFSEEYQTQLTPKVTYHQELTSSTSYFKGGCAHGGGMFPGMRVLMESTEAVGFAARGLFINTIRAKENPYSPSVKGPLRVWKQFFEDNILHQLNTC